MCLRVVPARLVGLATARVHSCYATAATRHVALVAVTSNLMSHLPSSICNKPSSPAACPPYPSPCPCSRYGSNWLILLVNVLPGSCTASRAAPGTTATAVSRRLWDAATGYATYWSDCSHGRYTMQKQQTRVLRWVVCTEFTYGGVPAQWLEAQWLEAQWLVRVRTAGSAVWQLAVVGGGGHW